MFPGAFCLTQAEALRALDTRSLNVAGLSPSKPSRISPEGYLSPQPGEEMFQSYGFKLDTNKTEVA
jgi:hypothetical protein